jgi:hypothetical protein
MTDEMSEKDALELLRAVEARRAQSENFTWTVPGLALTAEAFLLTIALAPDMTGVGRLLAAVAGLAGIVASWHFLEKQTYYFDLFESVIEAQRTRLGLGGTYRDALLDQHASFLEWSPFKTGQHKSRILRTLVGDRRAVGVWRAALFAFLLVDLFLAGYGIAQIAGHDPGWLKGVGASSTVTPCPEGEALAVVGFDPPHDLIQAVL